MSSLQFTDNLDSFLEAMEQGVARAVDKTTCAIVDTAQELAREDTTSMRESIHAVTELRNDREEAVEKAQRVNPQINITPPISLDIEEGLHQGIVDVAAEHSVYIHNGFQNFPGDPFLEEAGFEHKDDLKKNVLDELRDL
jgi:hypothetical protein